MEARWQWEDLFKVVKGSKWIKDLNVRPETIKLLEENIGKTLSNINHSRILCDPPPISVQLSSVAQSCSTLCDSMNHNRILYDILEIKAKINKWDLINLKSSCKRKETTDKMKRQPTEWEKIFANDMTDKGLISNIYK